MTLHACHQCDLVQQIPQLQRRTSAYCSRCDALLLRAKPNSIEHSLALLCSTLILFSLASSLPFLAIHSGGVIQESTLITGAINLHRQGMTGLGALVILTCIIIPLIQMLALFYVLAPLKFNQKAPLAAKVFRWYRRLQPWGMMEVFLLGILVAVVKLNSMATLIPGVAAIAFSILIFTQAAMLSVLEPQTVWQKLTESP